MKRLGYLFVILSLLVMMWGMFSWFDIVSDNCNPNPVHSDYNLFTILCEVGD